MAEPWEQFRNLCQYYADCVKYSERSQEYLFPDQLNKSFIIPRLPVNWHLKENEFVVETSSEDTYVRATLLKDSDEDELFIGYPLNSFVSPEGFECLCPVMMFPVSIAVRGAGFTTGLRMVIDRRGISINQDWVDYHISWTEQKAFRAACEHTEDEMGCVDVEMVLNYISTHFKSVPLNPNSMQFSVRNSQSRKCLLNTAVLFEGTKTKYTKTLLAELHRISKEPDDVLDKTALAYVFREPCLEYEPEGERKIPVSFTSRPMNAGQFAAVEDSLNNPIVKVIGPPGTGKSFMSVNLMANEVLSGGSVLFTSKNHKAIHAIFDKAPDAVKTAEFPLVSFCTTPDNPTNADWRKSQKDVDVRLDKIESLIRARKEFVSEASPGTIKCPSAAELDVWLSAYRDAEVHINRFEHLRDVTSRYERLLIDIDAALSKVPVAKRDSEEFVRLVEESERLLAEAPKLTLLQKIHTSLERLIKKSQPKVVDVRKQLSEVAPDLVSAIVSRKTLSKEVRRMLDLLKFRKIIREWEQEEYSALDKDSSETNYEELKGVVKKSVAGANRVVQKAFLEKMAARASGIEKADSLVAYCKDTSDKVFESAALEFMTGVDDSSKYAEPLAWFEKYLSIFPAWASTMLSLRRASPCLPGVFSLAIIDEASQCEIPPMIPVLYRARRAAIVGDPNQFPPVVTLKESRDNAFRRAYRVAGSEYKKFAYRQNNVFSVVPGKPCLLNEHFRCADGIAEYFNEEFYNGELSLCCDSGRSGASAVGALKSGMMWIDAPGGDGAEIEAALEYLRGLKSRGFNGSIGVISPLRDLANLLKTKVAENAASIPVQLDIQSRINTANGFQGGECDVILFLLGLNDDRSRGQDWYITAAENKYIYNVSVSRAKQVFVAFGDKKKVSSSGVSYIQKLIPEIRPPRDYRIGPGEERLRIALERAGIKTQPQFPVLNRFLDLAIPEKKIDIEVDGQAWHLDKNGCRKADDIHRDIQLELAGWSVVRVWHHEVVGDVEKCVDKVRAAMNAV